MICVFNLWTEQENSTSILDLFYFFILKEPIFGSAIFSFSHATNGMN